ncbi:hypothetical protein E4U52_004537 [Claviceps spartinae]|nr:hypothetical protein E4U52_004537 [Claviceps spartinae]
MKGLGSEDAIFADLSETSAELWRQLKAKYEIDSLASRDDLSVEQKVKALQEKKHRLRESTPTATNAERANAFADQTSVLASL